MFYEQTSAHWWPEYTGLTASETHYCNMFIRVSHFFPEEHLLPWGAREGQIPALGCSSQVGPHAWPAQLEKHSTGSP